MDSYSNSLRSSTEELPFIEEEDQFDAVPIDDVDGFIEGSLSSHPPLKQTISENQEEEDTKPIEINSPVLKELQELLYYSFISKTEYDRQLKILLENLQKSPKIPVEPVDIPPKISKPLSSSSSSYSHKEDEIELSRYEEIENKDGTITTKTYTTNAEGQRILITRIIKRTKIIKMVPKRVIERRNILKFGRCAGTPKGPEEGVTQIGDLVYLESLNNKEEEKTKTINTVAAIKCRNCNESGHWTKDCTHSKQAIDQIKALESELSELEYNEKLNEEPSEKVNEKLDEYKDTGSYVPPHLRKKSTLQNHENTEELTSLRITNLDNDATDYDLKTLFEYVARVKRATIARDRNTKESRGMGYVDMFTQEDCEAAIKRLNGYTYGNQVLHVEFVKQNKGR